MQIRRMRMTCDRAFVRAGGAVARFAGEGARAAIGERSIAATIVHGIIDLQRGCVAPSSEVQRASEKRTICSKYCDFYAIITLTAELASQCCPSSAVIVIRSLGACLRVPQHIAFLVGCPRIIWSALCNPMLKYVAAPFSRSILNSNRKVVAPRRRFVVESIIMPYI